jgi:hypothetical protein
VADTLFRDEANPSGESDALRLENDTVAILKIRNAATESPHFEVRFTVIFSAPEFSTGSDDRGEVRTRRGSPILALAGERKTRTDTAAAGDLNVQPRAEFTDISRQLSTSIGLIVSLPTRNDVLIK